MILMMMIMMLCYCNLIGDLCSIDSYANGSLFTFLLTWITFLASFIAKYWYTDPSSIISLLSLKTV